MSQFIDLTIITNIFGEDKESSFVEEAISDPTLKMAIDLSWKAF